MGFKPDDKEQLTLNKAIGLDQLAPDEAPDFKTTLMAAFRQENTFGSLIAQEPNLPDSVVENQTFDLWGQLSDEEKLDEQFLSNVANADNIIEVDAVRSQRAREQKDRAIISEGSFLPTLMAAGFDPINLIPVGGTAYRTYRSGASILASGMATGAVAAGTTAVTEAALHQTQLTRTFGESAVNVTAASFLGMVLGATPRGIQQLLTKSGTDNAKILDEIDKTMDPEAVIARGENSTFGDGTVGAAQVNTDAKVRGKFARAATKILGFDPLSRTITSNASSTRRAVNQLAENPLDMDQPLRTSVESKIKIHDGKLFEGFEANENAYLGYKQAGGNLKRRAFNEEVGKAIRNGSDDVNIQKAATEINAKVYEPLKNAAIEAKLLPDDVEVTTAKGYLNRLWNKEKLATNLDEFVKVTTDWLVNRQPELDVADASSLAREIAGRIQGTPEGRLPYDYKISENSSGGGKATALKGAFKARSFDIPDELVENFLENDVELLMGRYVKSVAPDIELVKEFGDVNMTSVIKDIEQEYQKLIQDASKAGDEKLARKLNKKKDGDIRDISAMRDRMRGTFGQADWDNPWVRAGRVARDLNYMRLLGGVVASSIPDVARVFAAEGIANTFSKGLAPMITNIKAFKASAREAKLYGVGTDALLGGRAEIIADVADFTQGGTAFERGVRSAATKFSSINLMNQWTGGVKQLHAVVTQSRLIDELRAGTVDRRLNQLGISEADALNIAGEMKKHSKKIDGVWIANSKDWANQDLAMMWGAALRKESDRVIIVPGQERPLFMSTELGKTIFQFKTFMFSATQRVLISNLQRQDKHYMQGMLGLVGIGMMAYAFKQWDAGRPLSDDPAVWITEGIDRSGMIGMLMEANNTIEKVTQQHYGLRPLLGINSPASRYASRTALDSALGPTFGLAGEVVRVAGAATGEREWADSDTRALRRLLPGQNLSLIRQALDKIEKEAAQ